MCRWGVTGKHNGEKVRLLRDEGVKVDAAGGRVIGSPWSGFRVQRLTLRDPRQWRYRRDMVIERRSKMKGLLHSTPDDSSSHGILSEASKGNSDEAFQ